jgi:hypothetical protein
MNDVVIPGDQVIDRSNSGPGAVPEITSLEEHHRRRPARWPLLHALATAPYRQQPRPCKRRPA